LGCYGLAENTVKWDFSKLLGVYAVVFTVIGILLGRFMFHENISSARWTGALIIASGGLVIQFGDAILKIINHNLLYLGYAPNFPEAKKKAQRYFIISKKNFKIKKIINA